MQSSQAVLEQYIEICNQAIFKNHLRKRKAHMIFQAIFKNHMRFPFAQIFKALRTCHCCCDVVINTQGDAHRYQFNFCYGTLRLCQCDHKGGKEKYARWVTSREYLIAVTQNPEQYVENPALLDWSWAMQQQSSR